MPVLISENLALVGKVVNGAWGIIKHVAYDLIGTKRVAHCVYLNVPASTLQLPGEDEHVIAIFPCVSPFTYTSQSGVKFNISRWQVPIVPGWAFTNYKAQGASLQTAIVDLASARNVQHAYVMLSRATSLKNLAILRKFSPQWALGQLPKDLCNELQRFAEIDSETIERFVQFHPNHVPTHAWSSNCLVWW